MAENHVDYGDYLELKFQLTYELKSLTENVNRLTQTTEKRLEDQDKKLDCLENKLQGAKEGKSPAGASSLPTNIKWLLILILGIAFLGALGAAIGINLLGYFQIPVEKMI